MNKVLLIILRITVVIIVGIVGSMIFLSKTTTESFPPIVNAQSCQVPAQVQNVLLTFPNCPNDVCNFTQANCTWGSTVGATKYNVVVTEVETGASIINTQVDSSVTSQVFSVSESNTYKCDVSAVNSCGTAGASGTFSLLCKVDAAVTITSAPPPSVPNVPPAAPPLPPTGTIEPTLIFGTISTVFIVLGIVLFVW